MRCAFCHEAIDLRGATLCEGCGTRLPVECGADLGRCPTLGCTRAIAGEGSSHAGAGKDVELAPPVGAGRPVAWVLFGVIVPVIAFRADASLRMDPLIWWGRPYGGAHSADCQVAVVLAVGLSILGLLAFLLGSRARAVPLLALGVALAGAHAIVFAPALPLSVIGIAFGGVGLLGLTPYFALWTYLDVLGRALREVREVSVDETKLPLAAELPVLIGLVGAVAIPLIRWQLG